MYLESFLYTNQGGRSHNEDCARWEIRENSGFFVVADGLGGHRGGEIASKLVAESLYQSWKNETMPPINRAKWLESEIHKADLALLAEQKMRQQSMKTTVAVLTLDDDLLSWTHVGDSRIYALSGGCIYPLTHDHSVSYKKHLAGQISRNALNFDEDRSSLLQAVGAHSRCRPHATSAFAMPGDAFLLCSDGFWEYVYDEEILADFLISDSPRQWVETLLVRILPRLRTNNDNATLLAVYLG